MKPRFLNEHLRCLDCAVSYSPSVPAGGGEKRKTDNQDLMLEAVSFLTKRVPGDPLKVKSPALQKFLSDP
jgi:hypothetical protein